MSRSPEPEREAKSGPRPGRWFVYVLRCRDGTLYCGITTDVPARVDRHNQGKGARYTRGRGPVVLVKSWPAVTRAAALRAEHAFKSLRREAKEQKLRSRARGDRISLLLKGSQEVGGAGAPPGKH